MAINGIVTAREAKVVAAEFERVAQNGTMMLLLMSMDPELRPSLGAAANVLKGLVEAAKMLKNASNGLKDTDEVFATTEMDLMEVEATAAVENLMGDFLK